MEQQTPWRVVSVGDLVCDVMVGIAHFPVEPARHQLVNRIQLEPGGAGNFLIAGARLGLQMQALGAVGKDMYGVATLEALSSERVDTRLTVQQPDGSTTTVFVLADGKGQHVFLGQYGEGPAIGLSAAWQAAVEQADAVQSWGYTLQEERLRQTMLDAMRHARAHGRTVFFDPGPYMQGVSAELREAALRHCSVLLLTEEEIPSALGGSGGIEQVRDFLQFGIEMVCVKRGRQGCEIFTAQDQAGHPGFEVTVRDTTAAGDSFAAAFIFATLKGWPLAQIAAFANAMGAAAVSKFGSGRAVPTLDEVRRVLQEGGLTAVI